MSWEEVARAVLPGGDVLTLRRRGDAFEIRFNLLELMASRNSVSERAMAEIACARTNRTSPQILIGGLGMGYTVRAVLDQVGSGARVTVAELVPEVITWNRGPLAGLAAHPLDDPRVTVCNDDVANVIRSNPSVFDVILMDVDNGPDAVLFAPNQFLYAVDGVKLILSSLRSGGVLAVWAADRSPGFERVLESGGFRFERVDVEVREKNGPAHTIYLVG